MSSCPGIGASSTSETVRRLDCYIYILRAITPRFSPDANEDSDAEKVAAIMAARARGTGIRRIARELGVGVGTVLRVTGVA